MFNRGIITQLGRDLAEEAVSDTGKTLPILVLPTSAADLPTTRRPSPFPLSGFVLVSVLAVLSAGQIACGGLKSGLAKNPDDKGQELYIPEVAGATVKVREVSQEERDLELKMPSKQELPLCTRRIKENCRVEHYSDQLESDLDK